MDPEKWGAATWWFEHWLADKVDSMVFSMRQHGYTGESDTKLQQKIIQLFVDFTTHFNEQLLPCQSCQLSTRKFLKKMQPKQIVKAFQTTGESKTSDFLFRLHNIVNYKLGKTQFTPAQFQDYITNTDIQSFPLANLDYIESAVLHCIDTKWPNKRKVFATVFSKFLAPLLLHLHTYASFVNLTKDQAKALPIFIQRYQRLTL